METNNKFQQRYETENFIIKAERLHFGDKDTDLRAKLHGIAKKDEHQSAYPDERKFSSRQITKFAKALCRSAGYDPENSPDEDSPTYQKEVENLLIRKKGELTELAKERQQYLNDNYDTDEGDEKESIVNDLVKRIYQYDGNPEIEEFADIKNFADLQEANRDLILRRLDEVLLTKKGKKKAEDLLEITHIDNPKQKAQDVLEQNFLEYYLNAIGNVHKGDEALKIWELISALSAKCSERQIDSWAVGPSGKGKSHIKRAIVKFLPHGSYEAPNSMTPKAMLYKTQKEGNDYYEGKLLFLDEAEGYDSDDAVVLLRGLTDPDEDTFEHEIVKDQEHAILEIKKPVTVWFTSVESIKDEQLKNRFILTNPDGSEELDNIVFEHQQINLHTGQELGKTPPEAAVVKEMIADIRSQTSGLTPIVPFKVDWKQKFNRRLYPYFVTLMEIIAKINYKNRVIRENYIYVTKADFKTAAVIWSELIDTTIAQTDTEALKLIMKLPVDKREAMRTSEIAKNLDGFNTDKVRRKADALRETEELQLINAEKEGGMWEYWAGRDRDRLVNPEPEIKADKETIQEILEKTEKGASQMVLDSMFDAEVPVYDRLKEQQDEVREEKMEEADVENLELNDDEKKLLDLMESLDFASDMNFITSQFAPSEHDDAWDVVENLEDRDLIKVYHEDGAEKPKKTRTYKRLRDEGKIVL